MLGRFHSISKCSSGVFDLYSIQKWGALASVFQQRRAKNSRKRNRTNKLCIMLLVELSKSSIQALGKIKEYYHYSQYRFRLGSRVFSFLQNRDLDSLPASRPETSLIE